MFKHIYVYKEKIYTQNQRGKLFLDIIETTLLLQSSVISCKMFISLHEFLTLLQKYFFNRRQF